MIAYLDASALLKLFLDEEGSVELRELWMSDLPISTSEIAVTEVGCALAAAVRGRRLQPNGLRRSVVEGTFLSPRAELVVADTGVVSSAAKLGVKHMLGALDAIHVASALVLRDAAPTLVSWDGAQRRAAAAEGLSVYP